MRYTRLYSDENGETHFEDVEVEFESVDFAPPAAPVDLSDPIAARRCAFLRVDSDWEGDAHPAPARQFIITLAGGFEVETSVGEIRQFGPGSVLLVEDLEGKGHVTRPRGDGGSAAIVQL